MQRVNLLRLPEYSKIRAKVVPKIQLLFVSTHDSLTFYLSSLCYSTSMHGITHGSVILHSLHICWLHQKYFTQIYCIPPYNTLILFWLIFIRIVFAFTFIARTRLPACPLSNLITRSFFFSLPIYLY